MNQQKIGKFILELRKEKNMTQQELADKIGVTDRAISKWENGRGMPDLSLFNLICKELDITINELMCGEKLEQRSYQKKFEENLMNVIVDEKNKNKKKRKICILIFTCVLVISLLLTCLYNVVELDIDYDKRIMTCNFENNKLTYQIKGVSVLNTNYVEKIINNNKYLIFHSTINLYNKRHSNWEYRESLANSIVNKKIPFGLSWEFDEESENYDNIIVYYSNKSLKKISKMSDSELKKELNNLNKMCSQNN